MKERLDILLVKRNLASSREKAKAIIMSGNVFVEGQREDKAGTTFPEEVSIEIKGHTLPYVSRGGLKLEKALKVFPLDLHDKVCCDFGASTGGFTDCMLMNGAKKVYAFDVGYGQLAWKLRTDERVINRERTNVRYLKPEDGEPTDFISVDVSFISLGLILPVVKSFLKPMGEAVCLIKPQFEAGKDKVGKKGVVRDISVHKEVIESVISLCEANNLSVKGLDFSPVKGPEGNIEYLIYLRNEENFSSCNPDVDKIVEVSHTELQKEQH